MDEQALAEKVVTSMLAKDWFSQWLGVEVKHLGPGQTTLAMKVRKEMLNGFGRCHGGIAFSLADSALAFASNSHGRVAYSIENSMSYPAAIHEGDSLEATAEEVAVSNRVGTYHVIVKRNGSDIVGVFRGVVYRSEKTFFEDK